MTTDLASYGFSFSKHNDTDITEGDLSGYHILVIVRPDRELSPSEVSAIRGFINAGHSLLVMSDGLSETATSAINNLLPP